MQPSNKVERVLRQAMDTFYGPADGFQDRLTALTTVLNGLVASDVGLDARLLHSDMYQLDAEDAENFAGPSVAAAVRRRQTPVTYINVYEDRLMAASVFVLRDRARIPLHDHPHMHGLMKVLAGRIRVQSFNTQQLDCNRTRVTHVGAEKLAPVIMGPDDYTNVLRPQHGNIHQVETVDGPAAIFDLLVPPYDTCAPETGPRRCRFFKEMHTSKGLQLTVVSQHKGYWNDVAPYKGPSISLYSNQQNAI